MNHKIKNSLRRIAKGNKADDSVVDTFEIEKSSGESISYTTADLFKNGKPMALILLNCSFNWLVNSMTYYGLSLNSAALPGSVYRGCIIKFDLKN